VTKTVSNKTILVRPFFLLAFLFSFLFAAAQPSSEENKLTSNLTFGSSLPGGVLSGRSLVLYESSYTNQELLEAQKYFQQAGIDAVSYIDIDYVLAGPDPSRVFATYFNTRVIKFFIILQKNGKEYQCIFTEFTGNKNFVSKEKTSWKQSNTSFVELLRTVYRFAISTQKKENFLINDVPETGFTLNFFREQTEKFSGDIRNYKSAIPRWGNEADEKELEAIVKENFPVKFEFVDPDLTDAELEGKGYRLVLRFVHTRGDIAREILGYDRAQKSSSLPTTYFVNGEAKIKTIPAKQMVYKFYFKNPEYGNIFLGSKWDADETWQDALKNHIFSLRNELRF
jgi:hypothetical protein